MPRSAASNGAMRAATREAVLTAAIRLFARRGFAATNMRDIARGAGVSTGLIYQHYATKDELFGDVVAQALDGLSATVRTLADSADAGAVLDDFTRGFLADLTATDGAAEFFMVLNQGFIADEPAGVRDRLGHGLRAFRGALTDAVERGQRDGRFVAGDPAELATTYLALFSGIVTTRLGLRDEVGLPGPESVMRVLTGGRTPTGESDD
ncbi:TetR/AcrR family transcriptional regulator [Polymorphospora rubra]|uniref:TetR family transcriptional regulator n=1 Tax=Polymorphospora rubra TaxID=338584 RepID=A0A810NA33_9ACTN|nr:TetR/AcrR family transcriptional regulator [Polymorphospora rubra]BCJ68979.1 TetR family transcriptional regulator [Polymorphospora rubra]